MKKRTILMWAMILPISVCLFISGCKDKVECPTVDYTGLDATIQQAQALYDNAVEGTEPGQYPAGAKADLQVAIDLAQIVRDAECVTQAELDAAKKNLETAIDKFEALECPTVDYTVIDATIHQAQDMHDTAVEGTEPGQYQPGAKAALQVAIGLAQSVRDTECVTQAELDAARTNLETAIDIFEALQCPIVDYTVLDATIQQAQGLYDAAVEGTEIGQYQVGAKAYLQNAINLAQSVRDAECITQSELDAAKMNLDAAIDEFETRKITDLSFESLVAHWLFNGDANDASGNGNNGTPTAGHAFWGSGAAPQLTADRFGNANYCYHFDQGSNIEVPYSTALNPQEITISFWIKMEEQVNNDYIISLNRWNGFKLSLQDQNYLFFTIKAIFGGNDVYYDRDSNPHAITADTWTHVAVTFADGFMNFYINGELAKEWDNTPGTPVAVDNINLSIGSDLPTGVYSTDDTSPYYVNWGGYFKGDMDDMRFYNIALTGTQVASIYDFESTNEVE
jgi:hypothetical protein